MPTPRLASARRHGEWLSTPGRPVVGQLDRVPTYSGPMTGLPLLTEAVPPAAANREYTSEATRRWSQAVDECDGFVFVTAEYNHGIPGAFKNAFDLLAPEWKHKAVAFVSYGADGGVRAVEQWRPVALNTFLFSTRGQVVLSLFTDFGENGFAPDEGNAASVSNLLDELIPLTGALKTLR